LRFLEDFRGFSGFLDFLVILKMFSAYIVAKIFLRILGLLRFYGNFLSFWKIFRIFLSISGIFFGCFWCWGKKLEKLGFSGFLKIIEDF
jgi:hypothetical protein